MWDETTAAAAVFASGRASAGTPLCCPPPLAHRHRCGMRLQLLQPSHTRTGMPLPLDPSPAHARGAPTAGPRGAGRRQWRREGRHRGGGSVPFHSSAGSAQGGGGGVKFPERRGSSASHSLLGRGCVRARASACGGRVSTYTHQGCWRGDGAAAEASPAHLPQTRGERASGGARAGRAWRVQRARGRAGQCTQGGVEGWGGCVGEEGLRNLKGGGEE